MSRNAHYETCRALADRGEDYGWNAYYKGSNIPETAETEIVEQGGAGWLEAFRAALDAYRAETGERWNY